MADKQQDRSMKARILWRSCVSGEGCDGEKYEQLVCTLKLIISFTFLLNTDNMSDALYTESKTCA